MKARPRDDTVKLLVGNHARFLRFLAPRLGGDRELAEEVLQAAFVKGVEKSAELRQTESAVAWFFRLLRNAVIDLRRRSAAEKRRLGRHAAALAVLTDQDEGPFRRIACRCVGELVPLLKPEYGEILRRAEIEGESLEEIARDNGITPNNAAVRLHRARKALLKKLTLACGTCTEHGCSDCTCKEV